MHGCSFTLTNDYKEILKAIPKCLLVSPEGMLVKVWGERANGEISIILLEGSFSGRALNNVGENCFLLSYLTCKKQ